MADLQFQEFVLLSCQFETWPTSRDEDEADRTALTLIGGSAGEDRFDSEYPAENLLRLRSNVERVGDEFFLVVHGRVEKPRLPFLIRFTIGARFTTVPTDTVDAERVKPTLFWLVYPFIREFVYNMTARSPLQPYSLPPLTRLPDPSLSDGETGSQV